MQIYIISPPPHSPGTRLDFHQLKSIAGSAVSSSLKWVLLLSRNKLMQEWKTFSKMLQAYTCTCCAWAPSALPQWWCDGGGSKLRKRCQNIISTELPSKYVNDTKTISALWDFVRIIYQKQNRLKFIIQDISEEQNLKSYLANLEKSRLLLAGHVLLVTLAEGEQCLEREGYLRSFRSSTRMYCNLPDAREQVVVAFHFWSQGSEKLQHPPLDKAEHTSCPG